MSEIKDGRLVFMVLNILRFKGLRLICSQTPGVSWCIFGILGLTAFTCSQWDAVCVVAMVIGERAAEVERFHSIKEAARHCHRSTQQVCLSSLYVMTQCCVGRCLFACVHLVCVLKPTQPPTLSGMENK